MGRRRDLRAGGDGRQFERRGVDFFCRDLRIPQRRDDFDTAGDKARQALRRGRLKPALPSGFRVEPVTRTAPNRRPPSAVLCGPSETGVRAGGTNRYRQRRDRGD
ncbi:hypothetical protein KCP73_22605 [Salmonella enterica subsp. enterica]|nr:hypothetical protein KCP73_22605 [Salmonella enterica subsp. enterica]